MAGVGLSSTLTAFLLLKGEPWPVAIAAAIGAGGLVGVINGLLTARLVGMIPLFPSFLPTLAMQWGLHRRCRGAGALTAIDHDQQPSVCRVVRRAPPACLRCRCRSPHSGCVVPVGAWLSDLRRRIQSQRCAARRHRCRPNKRNGPRPQRTPDWVRWRHNGRVLSRRLCKRCAGYRVGRHCSGGYRRDRSLRRTRQRRWNIARRSGLSGA